MSEKRTIQFNPEFLKFSNNKTRKKRPTENNGPMNEIKVKEHRPKKRDDTLRKRSILRMIRAHQQDNYNKMFNETERKKENKLAAPVITASNSEFEESKKYMDRLIEEKKDKANQQNTTLKRYSSTPYSMLYNNSTFDNVLNSPIEDVTNTMHEGAEPKRSSVTLQNNPQYGCLKQGNLPTYRNWMQTTQKNTTHQRPISLPNYSSAMQTGGASSHSSNEIMKTMAKLQTQDQQRRLRNKRSKQKRIMRRTFTIGKSKVLPKVSVLVSNRTIRNNISTKTQQLKQVSIQEVKKFLIKRGFIRVGSVAPNDVLRKMYEASSLMCGEIQNYNPENMLYNFIHDDNEK